MKVLILSCSTGGGHNACAKYILEELKENNIEAKFKDFYEIVNKNGKDLSSKIYLSSLIYSTVTLLSAHMYTEGFFDESLHDN